MKAPTLKQQIAAVQECVEINVRSHTHLIGRFKGRIPPGKDRDQTDALRAAAKTLRKLLKKV